MVGGISQDFDYIHPDSQICFWKAVLTGVHFSANVLGEGGDFPSAYLNKSGRIGTHLSLVLTCQNVRLFISTEYWALLLKGPREKK